MVLGLGGLGLGILFSAQGAGFGVSFHWSWEARYRVLNRKLIAFKTTITSQGWQDGSMRLRGSSGSSQCMPIP